MTYEQEFLNTLTTINYDEIEWLERMQIIGQVRAIWARRCLEMWKFWNVQTSIAGKKLIVITKDTFNDSSLKELAVCDENVTVTLKQIRYNQFDLVNQYDSFEFWHRNKTLHYVTHIKLNVSGPCEIIFYMNMDRIPCKTWIFRTASLKTVYLHFQTFSANGCKLRFETRLFEDYPLPENVTVVLCGMTFGIKGLPVDLYRDALCFQHSMRDMFAFRDVYYKGSNIACIDGYLGMFKHPETTTFCERAAILKRKNVATYVIVDILNFFIAHGAGMSFDLEQASDEYGKIQIVSAL